MAEGIWYVFSKLFSLLFLQGSSVWIQRLLKDFIPVVSHQEASLYSMQSPYSSCLPKEACAHGAHAVPLSVCGCAHTVALKPGMTLQSLLALALPDCFYTHQCRNTTGWSQNAFASEHRLDSPASRFCHRNTLAVGKLIKKMIKDQKLRRETIKRNNLFLADNADLSEIGSG